jgi:hypothetical protein
MAKKMAKYYGLNTWYGLLSVFLIRIYIKLFIYTFSHIDLSFLTHLVFLLKWEFNYIGSNEWIQFFLIHPPSLEIWNNYKRGKAWRAPLGWVSSGCDWSFRGWIRAGKYRDNFWKYAKYRPNASPCEIHWKYIEIRPDLSQ